MAALTITDDANGTSVTATVSGSAVTDTNTVYKHTWTGVTGTLSFSSAGSRVGDGNISISTGVGTWLWLLESVTTGLVKTNTVVFQNSTDSSSAGESVLSRILTAVKTQIVALNLSGISSSDVIIRWMPRQLASSVDPLPNITICPAPLPVSSPNYLTATDHVGYPVLIVAKSLASQDYDINIARNTLWIEKIMREFRFQGIDTIVECSTCIPEPKAIIDPSWFHKDNILYHAVVMRFVCREGRGN